MSTRTPGPPGVWKVSKRPALGRKVSGVSALTRHSMACPCGFTLSVTVIDAPAAMRSCSFTMSTPVTTSVTACSTWMRVFISMK